MQQLKNMGSIKNMLGMLPGARGHAASSSTTSTSPKSRAPEAIIQSMTLQERRVPKVLNGSRRVRIAQAAPARP